MNSQKRFALIISVAMVLAIFVLIAPVVYVPPPTPHYGSGCPQTQNYACTGISYSAQSMYYSVSEVLLSRGMLLVKWRQWLLRSLYGFLSAVSPRLWSNQLSVLLDILCLMFEHKTKNNREARVYCTLEHLQP